MIKPNTARPGLVFRDPHTPTARKYWRLAEELPDGSWRAEHLTDKRNKPRNTYTVRDLERCEPVPDDPTVELNIDCLLGRRVRLETDFGKSSGFVTEVVVQELAILGSYYQIPVAVVVGGDEFALHQISKIEEREG